MTMIKRASLFSIITLVSILIDQATKWYAAEFLPKFKMTSYLADTLRIGYAENTGAFLGLGSGLSDSTKFWIFVCAVGVILLALLVYIFKTKSQPINGIAALSLIFSGGISNFYDRATNNGAVIDFLNLGIGSFRTGIFNVADMAIMLGVFILLFVKTEDGKQNAH
ncbi:signal peptidase II [Paraglaciecola aquimarina]|uniref:Lipoprotein signal peptidase n=1 Tax=Paraglaciecola aquimarina TaxID=1235557 RepID=A0ABU3T1J9_9ALTE|nr:signal peptidase II [Paraglaciecola aquimarina]MDU0356144.1 signal peptidase II [Paraglaciecola aquimarina]